MFGRIAVTAVTAAVTSSCVPSNVPEPVVAPSTPPDLGRAAFVQELISAQPTARTRLFDDYTGGSYHVEKLDLLEGVREIRRRDHVIALAVFGPSSILWTYHVVVVLEDGDGYRLNTLTMPHARITSKGTRLISMAEYKRARRRLTSLPTMVSGPPTFDSVGGPKDSELELEWRYSFLLADWSAGSERLWHARYVPEPELESIATLLNGLLEDTKTTYPRTGIERFGAP